uniref:Uncharacterized protein n=1 Tax=Anopheles farauti TaxID=69004 RepID=A0A182Q888_9DIPT
MVNRFVVCCLVLLLANEAKPESIYLQPDASSYCPIPKDVLEEKNANPGADFWDKCVKSRQEDEEKIKQSVAIVKEHLQNQTKVVSKIQQNYKQVSQILPTKNILTELDASRRVVAELRSQVLVAAIEADRIQDAFKQYMILGAWSNWKSIVDRIFENPRRKWRHIENLLGFIRILPSRQERTEYYRYLKPKMVPKKDYESYVGLMFAIDARNVVYAPDGKTALNQTDEQDLYKTMLDASTRYFRRAVLTGINRVYLRRLDQNHPDLFDTIFESLFNPSDSELNTLHPWRMTELPCLLYRPMTKARVFQALIDMLAKRFKWPKKNEYYAPMMAGFLEVCLTELQKHKDTNAMVDGLKKSFEKFGKDKNYNVLLKKIGKNVHSYAG